MDDLEMDGGHRPQNNNNNGTQQTPPPAWTIPIWEEVIQLWTCLLLSPTFPTSTREAWKERLTEWSTSQHAPRDDIYFVPALTNARAAENLTSEAVASPPLLRPPSRTTLGREPTSVFQLALDVSNLPVQDDLVEDYPAIPRNALADIARTLPANVQQCTCPYCGVSLVIGRAWGLNETFTAACLRASSLYTMGYRKAAAKLALALANALSGCLDEVARRSTSSNNGPCSPPPQPPPSFLRSTSNGSSELTQLLRKVALLMRSCRFYGGIT